MVSKKVRQGPVEVDYERSALLVNFTIETVSTDESGRTVEVLDRRPESRRIKINSLDPDKNLALLASQIVDSCKYVHPSRTEEIEQLLIKLQKHVLSHAQDESAAKSGADARNNEAEEVANVPKKRPQDDLPPADMDKLDDYLELLYAVGGNSDRAKEESTQAQIHGTQMILTLCRDVLNLEQLIQNSTVMGALTRVLQEEYKKSVELSFNILRIFLAFSNFVEMHSIMSNYRIGVLTIRAVELQVKRSEHREREAQELDFECEKQVAAAARDEPDSLPEVKERCRRRKRAMEKKVSELNKKEEKLLFVAFHILINLAEDISVERKMVKKSLVASLLRMLDHSSADLLILITTFLRKLSVYRSNKQVMKELNVVTKVVKFIPCSSVALVNSTIRLLFNLSFDAEVRAMILNAGLLSRLVSLLKTPALRACTLKLLYQLSYDERARLIFAHSDGVAYIVGMVVNFPKDRLPRELAALAVNLSQSDSNCEAMIKNRGLNHMVDRLANTRDALLFKVIRNISLWTFNMQQQLETGDSSYKYRGLWSPHIKVLLEIVYSTDDHETLIEAFGTLANLTPLDLPQNQTWGRLLRDDDFFGLINRMLVPGICQNDMLLEVVLVLSTIASDRKALNVMAKTNIIGQLYTLWQEKSEGDAELCLQMLHLFHKLLMHEDCREEVMYATRIVSDMIDKLNHENAAVRHVAGRATALVLELDRREGSGELGELGVQIRKKRFEGYNRQWMAMLDVDFGGGAGGADYLDDDDHDEHGTTNDGSMDWGTLMESRQRLTLEMNELERQNGNYETGKGIYYDQEESGGASKDDDDEEWERNFR